MGKAMTVMTTTCHFFLQEQFFCLCASAQTKWGSACENTALQWSKTPLGTFNCFVKIILHFIFHHKSWDFFNILKHSGRFLWSQHLAVIWQLKLPHWLHQWWRVPFSVALQLTTINQKNYVKCAFQVAEIISFHIWLEKEPNTNIHLPMADW